VDKDTFWLYEWSPILAAKLCGGKNNEIGGVFLYGNNSFCLILFVCLIRGCIKNEMPSL
jgi:hypothetical protein